MMKIAYITIKDMHISFPLNLEILKSLSISYCMQHLVLETIIFRIGWDLQKQIKEVKM